MQPTIGISVSDLKLGLSELDRLAIGEFGVPLASMLRDDEEYFAFKRLGRLAAVWVKHPFAMHHPYDPDVPVNWARSHRAWVISSPVSNNLPEYLQSRYRFLEELSAEWNRPVQYLAEFNIFYSVCRRIHPFICDESDILKKLRTLQIS